MCQGKGEGNRERPGPPPFLDRGSEQDEVFALRCVRGVALVVPARPVVRAVLPDVPPVQGEVADDLQDVVVEQVGRPVADRIEVRGLEQVVFAVADPSVRCRLPLAGVELQHRPPRVARRVRELHDGEAGGVSEADEGDGLRVVGRHGFSLSAPVGRLGVTAIVPYRVGCVKQTV